MSTRSGRVRIGASSSSPPRTRKGVSPPRSPARTRKASPPARSPSRKSPARKSPSRKPASKFPARKSPSRTTKEIIEHTKSEPAIATTVTTRRSSHKATAEGKSDNAIVTESLRSRRPRRTEYSIQDVRVGLVPFDINIGDRLNGLESLEPHEKVTVKPTEEVAPRRSSRLRDNITATPIPRKSLSKSLSQSIATFSEGDDSEMEFEREKSKSMTRKLVTPLRESIHKLPSIASKLDFGGRFLSIPLMLLLPLTVFAILNFCKNDCTLESLNFVYVKDVYSPFAWTLLASQVVLQMLIATFPIFGKRAPKLDGSEQTYCFNAFCSTTLVLIFLFGFDYFKIFNNDFILNQLVQLATCSYVLAVILSVVLYVRSRKLEDGELNPYGNTGYTLYDFCMGREIHPYFKRLNIKILISRICNINTLTLSILLLKHGISVSDPDNLDIKNYQELFAKLHFKPTVLVFSMMQMFYILNFIVKEHMTTASFFWQYEGVGYYQTVSSAIYPFYFMTISKSIVDGQVSLSTNVLIFAAVLYLTGFFILLASNNIKYELRTNPNMFFLDTMPTFHGKRLIVSNLWGIVRHPNYAGDIMIHVALSLPGILSGRWISAVPAILTILILLHRSWRDHARCQRRYGAAWQRYCKRVSSVIIPKVF